MIFFLLLCVSAHKSTTSNNNKNKHFQYRDIFSNINWLKYKWFIFCCCCCCFRSNSQRKLFHSLRWLQQVINYYHCIYIYISILSFFLCSIWKQFSDIWINDAAYTNVIKKRSYFSNKCNQEMCIILYIIHLCIIVEFWISTQIKSSCVFYFDGFIDSCFMLLKETINHGVCVRVASFTFSEH